MAKYTYVDSQEVLDQVEAEKELALEKGFSVSTEELLTLSLNNKEVMFAGVYLLDDGSYDALVAEVLNEDLDTRNVEYPGAHFSGSCCLDPQSF